MSRDEDKENLEKFGLDKVPTIPRLDEEPYTMPDIRVPASSSSTNGRRAKGLW